MSKHRKIIVLTIIFCLLAVYGNLPIASAASLTNASDTLSDSDTGSTSNHTVVFYHSVALSAGDYMQVILPAVTFGDITVGAITCPGSTNASAPATTTARCTATGAIAAGTSTITLTGLANPSAAGSKLVQIETRDSGNALIENVDIYVAIIDNVLVTARVSSTLTFEIRPLNSGTDVNGFSTNLSSATTTLAFGTLTVGTSSVMGQELRVTSNADDGYTVTVEQDGNLTSLSASDIDSFIDGTSTNPAVWQSPANTLDVEWTYGHMGVTSDDANISSGDFFGNALYKGFNGTSTMEVMFHTGPADGLTQNEGMAKVAYRIQIGSLQEAGDYTNVLTYICTPIY